MDLSNETNVWKQALLDIPVARKLWSARIEPKARDNQLRIGVVDIRMTSLDEVVELFKERLVEDWSAVDNFCNSNGAIRWRNQYTDVSDFELIAERSLGDGETSTKACDACCDKRCSDLPIAAA